MARQEHQPARRERPGERRRPDEVPGDEAAPREQRRPAAEVQRSALRVEHRHDSTLGKYYNDESFGIRPADITKTEKPTPGLTIYRDRADVPHVFANGDATLAFGAAYAQAEDRLFLMDVLRHYGAGRTSEFLGASCADEQMDHEQLLLAPYTEAQAQQQIDTLPAKYGPAGVRAKTLITNYVKGVNAHIANATRNPTLLPADYAATVPNIGDGTVALPKAWKPSDVVYVAGLIGGIFGKGGGVEVANAAQRTYLGKHLARRADSPAEIGAGESRRSRATTQTGDHGRGLEAAQNGT